MADRFFDTSAVVKYYRVESGTAQVAAFLAEVGSRHLISSLAVVEMHSVMARLVRTGQIASSDFHSFRGRFLADVAAGLWQMRPLTDDHFHRAQELLVRHAVGRGLRTLDALQLAAALGLHAASPLGAFVSADANLCQVAAVERLVVVNPADPEGSS